MADELENSVSFSVPFETTQEMVAALGAQDELLRVLSGVFPSVSVTPVDQDLTVRGPKEEANGVKNVLEDARQLARLGTTVTLEVIEELVRHHSTKVGAPAVTSSRGKHDAAAGVAPSSSGFRALPPQSFGLNILTSKGRSIRPKTVNQQRYVDAIDNNTIIFGIGPAGTGKTYLAMAKAVQALQAKEVSRIILTRPAVEAGEKLGFLPGTLTDKIDPYLRPLYDALHDMVDGETIPRLLAAGTIEVAPLAYMRGRTLNDAFIILDEAQNTTPEQIKMFLTRLGFGAKMVITGDITQVDLPGNTRSGLRAVTEILDGVDDISFQYLESSDVVRHRLVSQIVSAYEKWTDEQSSEPRSGHRKIGKKNVH
ncbi:phosphate starvation-inducible PhoH-like protein [Neomicrococcus aestuarii]|uniref:PhoH-like protein n=1 Tax=Neomicrococcus aestuarii TaxID=556325 RepID=A0A7W8WY48_9MICC|nr:PhoH family protein [Neomicrococcus aestuarii]MBB5511941.1 phosphate starvation-inducible PhoH-like protein [Neomicrococcus aestuarii]